MPMPKSAYRSSLSRASTGRKDEHPHLMALGRTRLSSVPEVDCLPRERQLIPLHPFRGGIEQDQATTRLAELVQRLRSGPRAGLLALRALTLSLGPDVAERVTATTVTYLRRERAFLGVESVRTRLLATFPSDITLNDPMGRLLKRGEQRYFRVDDAGDLDAHIQQFVRQAYSAARPL